MSKEFLLGNEAIARGLLEAGVDVATGYPGTPSSEILAALAPVAGERGFHIEWSVNEKVAMEVAIGAAWAGARSVVTMKHVGLNVAADPFMTLSHTGVVGGMIVLVADDPFCHSSQNEQDSRMYAKFAKIPCLDPCSPQEAKDMIAYAYELSEKYQTPVMFRPTTRVSHGKSDVTVGDLPEGKRPVKFTKDVERFVVLPKHTRALLKKLNAKQEALRKELLSSPWNKVEVKPEAKLGIIASGVSSKYVEEALASIKEPVSYLKIGAYPVDPLLITKLAESVDKVLVIEELMPIVEEQVRMYADDVAGKMTGEVPHEGEFDTLLVSNIIRKLLKLPVLKVNEPQTGIDLPMRPPALCPGCPHRATFYALKSVFKDESIFASDIGCYTLGTQMGAVDTCICMGASITIASGLSFAGVKNKVACTIGDSTFLHTGIPGLMNAVYNKANITVVILDNRTTAMTGHQQHPALGEMITGEPTTEVSLESMVKACGVDHMQVVNPFDMETTKAAFRNAYESDGVNVIISRQPCIITAKRIGIKRKQYEVIEDLCEGCKRCVKFGCPAMEFKNGKAVTNDQCAGCGVCSDLCQFGAIKIRSK
ncbi:MAG: indolepyruvate ferredoxin oxidoreductase subunit alpha [Methanocella sp.]